MLRRDFLRVATTGALTALALPRHAVAQMGGMHGMGSGAIQRPPTTWPTGRPLQRLRVLANEATAAGEFEATLVASPYSASLLSGTSTTLWGYNDDYPGPLIELQEGDRVAIEFLNRLALDSTIHWHGLAIPAAQDGNPMDPVPPGAARRYEFEIPSGSAGTYWYHPHAHGTTTLQVGHGLAAPIVVRGNDDPLKDLPEWTLMITSLSLGPEGQVSTSGAGSTAMMGSGMMGSMMGAAAMGGELLVNGQRVPVHTMAPGATQRWRIINATADRYLRLGIEGHDFTVVGTDGGLLQRALPGTTQWLLAPAQRVEIVVTIAARSGARYSLRDLGYGAGMGTGAGSDLMTIETRGPQAATAPPLPAVLRAIADPDPAAATQRVVLSSAGMGMMGSFLLNGRTFDMERVDLESVAGRTELWELVMDHPIHIHGTQFQVVSRTSRGTLAPVQDPGWLDTVNVPAGESVTIKVSQKLPGKRMFHCHILPHEDAGMMGVLDVRPA